MVVPIGAHQVGQHLGVAGVRLRSRCGVAIPIASRRHRVDGVDLVARGEQRPHDEPAVDLDADDHRLVLVGMLGDESMEIADPGHAVGNAAFAEDHSVLGHHADVVMVLGPVHSHKEHCSSSRS